MNTVCIAIQLGNIKARTWSLGSLCVPSKDLRRNKGLCVFVELSKTFINCHFADFAHRRHITFCHGNLAVVSDEEYDSRCDGVRRVLWDQIKRIHSDSGEGTHSLVISSAIPRRLQ